MKKVLVIGGNGFIGTNLVQTLLSHGEDVSSFDIQKPTRPIAGVRYIEGDFFDDECLEESLIDIDVVYHSLSTVNPGNSNKRFLQGYSRDFVQSVKLFDMCLQKQIKVIFLSSGGTVYGLQKEQPIKETALPQPINHYGTVKLCIESVLKTFNTQIHSNMLIARISNPYGPGQDFHKGVGFIDAALKKSMKHETIEVWGDGSVIRDYIYIDDVCEMLYSLMYYEGDEEVFNLSSNHGVSINDIIKEIDNLGLEPKVTYEASRAVDVPKVILDNTRIMKIYQKQITSLDVGIQKYYQHLKQFI